MRVEWIERRAGDVFWVIGDAPTNSDVNAVMEMPLSTPDGQTVRLSQVARLDAGQTTASVQRQNRQRTLIITAGLDPNVTLGEASTSLQRDVAQIAFPPAIARRLSRPGRSSPSSAPISAHLG